MFANPVQKVDSHGGSFISKSFFYIFKNIFNSNAMSELAESVECFLDHLSSLLSKFTNNVEELWFGCRKEVFSETFCHDRCYFESPENNIEVTVID